MCEAGSVAMEKVWIHTTGAQSEDAIKMLLVLSSRLLGQMSYSAIWQVATRAKRQMN